MGLATEGGERGVVWGNVPSPEGERLLDKSKGSGHECQGVYDTVLNLCPWCPLALVRQEGQGGQEGQQGVQGQMRASVYPLSLLSFCPYYGHQGQ